MKSVALRKAAAAGVTETWTANDFTNQPMLAINDWLGYRAAGRYWSYVRVLSQD